MTFCTTMYFYLEVKKDKQHLTFPNDKFFLKSTSSSYTLPYHKELISPYSFKKVWGVKKVPIFAYLLLDQHNS